MNQVIKSLPVYTEASKEFFLDHPQLPIATVSGFDTEVFTAPLLIGKRFDLIALSMIESELEKGNQHVTMNIGNKVSLSAIYLELGNNLIKIDCEKTTNLCEPSDFTLKRQSNLILDFRAVTNIGRETLNTAGEPIDIPYDFKDNIEFVTVTIRGDVNPVNGMTELVAGLKLQDYKEDEVMSSRQEYFSKAKVVAFDLNYTLEHHLLNKHLSPVDLDEAVPKIVINGQREVLIRGTIEYLDTMDEDHFKFLLTKVYGVGTAVELVHFFSTRDVRELENALMTSLGYDPRYKSVDQISYRYQYSAGKTRSVYMECTEFIDFPPHSFKDSPLWKKALEDNEVSLPPENNYFKTSLRTIEGSDVSLNISSYDVHATINGIAGYTLPQRWFNTDASTKINAKSTKETDPTICDYSTKQSNPFAIRKEGNHAVLMAVHTDGYQDFTLLEWTTDESDRIANIKKHFSNSCHDVRVVDMMDNKVHLSSHGSLDSYHSVVEALDLQQKHQSSAKPEVSVEPPSTVYFTKTNNLMPFAVRLKGLDGRVALMLSNVKGWYDVKWKRTFEQGGDSRTALESYLQHNCGLMYYSMPSSDLLYVQGDFDEIVKALKEAEEACSK